MKVKELIRVLETLPDQDAVVLIDNKYSGLDGDFAVVWFRVDSMGNYPTLLGKYRPTSLPGGEQALALTKRYKDD